MRLGGQATQRTWKIMWNQINCFRRAVNATGEGEGEEGARSIAQSYECVCATDRFDRGRVCDDVRDERCSRGVFRCRGGENGSCRRRCVCHSFSRKLCEKQNISPPFTAHTRLVSNIPSRAPLRPSPRLCKPTRYAAHIVSSPLLLLVLCGLSPCTPPLTRR